MDCLTEILKHGEMSTGTREALDQLEADFFTTLKETAQTLDQIDESAVLQNLADSDDSVKCLLVDIYNGVNNFSYCYNLRALEHNKHLI